jgi:predicted signal transduction protein with EAL and GGDEF domain
VTALGCTQAQGYHFAKAMPALEIPSYLDAEARAASEGRTSMRRAVVAASDERHASSLRS